MLKICLALLLLPTMLFAGITWTGKVNDQFSAEITLSTPSLPVDKNLEVTLLLRFPETYSVDLDTVRVNLLKYAGLSEPPFALISEKVEDLPNGKKIIFQLEPLLEGIHFLSLYDIEFNPKDKNTPPIAIISEIFEIEVTLPSIDAEFRGVVYPLLSLTTRYPLAISPDNRKDLLLNPLLQQFENERNASIIKQKTFPFPQLVGIALFLFLLLIARMQPKKSPDLDKLRKKQALTSKKKALKALTSLQNRKLPQKNAYDEYYIDLTNTVRRYIEENYQIKATTSTTPEFLESMTQNPIFDEKTKNLLQNFLISADQVKFAAYKPAPEEWTEAFQIAKQFIEYVPLKKTEAAMITSET
jgi:hypothetical protein